MTVRSELTPQLDGTLEEAACGGAVLSYEERDSLTPEVQGQPMDRAGLSREAARVLSLRPQPLELTLGSTVASYSPGKPSVGDARSDALFPRATGSLFEKDVVYVLSEDRLE